MSEDDLTDRRQCPICGSAEWKFIGRKKTLDPASALTVELVSCSRCGHWWITPAPSEERLLRLYAESSPLVVTANAQEQYVHRVHLDWFSSFVEKRARRGKGTYLEIGAGGGHLMHHFAARGYDCWAVEPGQWNPGHRIVRSLDEVPASMAFDLIVMQDVLEHTADPLSMIAAARRRAAGGGLLFCSFPCSDSPVAVREGVNWSMVLPLAHLHYFSRRSAELALSKSGWRLTEARLTRMVSLRRLAARFQLKLLAWQLLKGGADQLYLAAAAS